MKDLKLVRGNVNYKGHQIVEVEDSLGRRVSIILGVEKMFHSIEDAKRFMNFDDTVITIESYKAKEYAKAAKELFEDAMMNSLRP